MTDEACSVGVELNLECHKLDYDRSKGIENLSDLNKDVVETLLWRAGLKEHKGELSTICFHHKKYFGNVFEHRAKASKKCRGGLLQHKSKVKGVQLISLVMAKELEVRGYNVTPGHILCPQCMMKYVRLIDDTDRIDADYTCELLQTPQKNLNISLKSMDISPVALHGVAPHSRVHSAKRKLEQVIGTLKSDLSTVYKVDAEELTVSESVHIEKEIKEKALELDRLHDLMKEKLKKASTPDQIQIMTLAPDSWSREYCSKFFKVSEYVVRTARELKNVSGILSKSAPKKGKKLSPETAELVVHMYENDEYSRQMPGKKDYVSIAKGVHKQKHLILCNLDELYAAFKQKYPNVKVGFSKFSQLRPKWCVLAGSKGTHSVCVCSIHQNAKLLVDAIGWDVTYKDLISKLVCDSSNKECMMHRCEACPGREALQKFLDEKLVDVDPDDEFHFSQWDTTDRATLSTRTTTYEEYKDFLIDKIDNLTRHSYITKCQTRYLTKKKENLCSNEVLVLVDFAENYQFLIQDEIQSFHWSKEYCTLHPVVLYYRDSDGTLKHLSLCFISNDNTHDTAFVYQTQTMTVHYIRALLPHVNKMTYFSDGCGGQYKNYKNFINLCLHKQDFGIDAEWVFFATSHGKSPCDGIGGSVKRHVAKRSLQRPLNNQILDYKAMLEVCLEMSAIKFFDISMETMEEVRKFLEARFARGNTVPGSRSSHHFAPLSTSNIGHKLTSEDESYTDNHDFNLPSILEISDISPMQYVTCVYNSFWWIGIVNEINAEEGDVTVKFMHPHGPRKTFNWPQIEDTWFVPIKKILCVVSPTTYTGRTYKITDEEYEKTISAFQWHKENNSM